MLLSHQLVSNYESGDPGLLGCSQDRPEQPRIARLVVGQQLVRQEHLSASQSGPEQSDESLLALKFSLSVAASALVAGQRRADRGLARLHQ